MKKQKKVKQSETNLEKVKNLKTSEKNKSKKSEKNENEKWSEKSFHKRTPPPPSSGYGIIIE